MRRLYTLLITLTYTDPMETLSSDPEPVRPEPFKVVFISQVLFLHVVTRDTFTDGLKLGIGNGNTL